MLYALLLIPAIAGAAAFFVRSHTLQRAILIGTALIHAALTACVSITMPSGALNGWIALDPIGRVFLGITSVLFLVSSIYSVGYLRREKLGRQKDEEEGFLFSNAPEAVFTACLLLFLATMTLVCLSRHMGLLWVAIEATTLSSAPLIYFHRHHRSLEAVWKYLMICSVGIALAFLGNIFFAAAAGKAAASGAAAAAGAAADLASHSANNGPHILQLDELLRRAPMLQVRWLHGAFILLLVGYGTKMGLAPLHTWLPDAHSESPSVVSALLSGALLNCAFVGILRGHQVLSAAGQAAFAQELLLGFGLISLAIAAIFILRQADYKRMLAYSSVEHIGIIAIGTGLGGGGVFGAMLHAVNHSLVKAMLFFLAGNILAVFRTKASARVQGVSRVLPISGMLFVFGFLAIAGAPPFGLFISEFTILRAALEHGHTFTAIVYLVCLGVIFTGMSAIVLKMVQGSPIGGWDAPAHIEPVLAIGPPIVLCAASLFLGLYIPQWLSSALHLAAAAAGGQ